MRALLPYASVVIGILCGISLFMAGYLYYFMPYTNDPAQHAAWTSRFDGTVAVYDPAHHVIVLRLDPPFPDTASSTDLASFHFDNATAWVSLGFYFQGDVMTNRRISAVTQPDALPEGTLVNVVRDIAIDSPWRAAMIGVLSKTSL